MAAVAVLVAFWIEDNACSSYDLMVARRSEGGVDGVRGEDDGLIYARCM